ncbi:MAG: cyclic nucleotide-binding domain-containing protein [Candidatus Marinimicrobia bacterium]|jgi:CRP-like cAMP-binding protein|nr:cyclic nucleotide-binding domain-containing protein [Candidatus Neomarinimicrobiota bacterium]MBT3631654.1 cyclic nucleotide-binding domain-containing protein [Candidatus Neomarinimicrobiota bacterium]MBT3825855.1 cyclic nucleotide-binding domain-containing protein [Candidatus Neomarinimicrobiota bacterium]MBT4129952.1 cyclic nucleotide-binding domain-containing protein [Candidatus Neomarinimicrobiota bacterium]MBT4296062.1 cyclic nucleotide-binding domain-containing protein [Candidatus Neom
MKEKPITSYPLFESFKDKLKPNRSQAQMTLSQVNVFSRLSWQEIKIIENAVHIRNYGPGEPVFKQGDPGSGMYIIIEGSVGIFLDIPQQTPKQLSKLGDGDFFGEIALLDESPRTASATALENSTIIGFYRPDLMDILKTKPALGAKILLALSEVLAVRLRSTNGELVKVSRKLETVTETEANE